LDLKLYLPSTDIISVEANVAAAFNLRTYDTMIMNIVDPSSVALDSVEITFKDQYMGRSEMWRLKSFLVRDYSRKINAKLDQRFHVFSDQYLRVHEQKNRTLFRTNSVSSVRDVGARRTSFVWCHQRGNESGVPQQYVDGVPIHSDVVGNVGL